MSSKRREEIQEVIGRHRPDYASLFGSVELCDCEHCRSIYSPAAYLVDLLEFLDPTKIPAVTPLDVLIGNGEKTWPDGKPVVGRRPDLAHIQLSCENTNTTLPYVDLVNEVLESYIAVSQTLPLQTDADDEPVNPPIPEPNESSPGVTAAELAANPENTRDLAYKKLQAAVYPLSLPFNQPIAALRLTLEQMGTSRHEVMGVFGKKGDEAAGCARDVEALKLTEGEFAILTDQQFDGTPASRSVSDFYGFEMPVSPTDTAWVEELTRVPTFLARTGISYVELIELLRTQYFNPALPQGEALVAFERIPISYSALATLVASNFADPTAQTLKVLADAEMTVADLAAWAAEHFGPLGKLIVLDAPDSVCDLTLTRLQHLDGTQLDAAEWSRLHRFIRLWRKIGWTVQDLDRAIIALQAPDITPSFLRQLGQIVQLQAILQLSPQELLSFWGAIPAWGHDALYGKLFLNKAVRDIDPKFAPVDGEYLPAGASLKINGHVPALLAGLRTRAADLALIREHTKLAGDDAPLTLATATTLYRYVTLARALKMAMKDLIALQALSGQRPFSTLSNSNDGFADVDPAPARTLRFVRLAGRVVQSGFTPAILSYLFSKLDDAPSSLALSDESISLLLATIREGLIRVAAENVATDDPTGELTRAKLDLLFEAHMVEQVAGLIAGTQIYTAPLATLPADVSLPKGKVTYDDKASHLLTATGWLTDTEKSALLVLSNVDDYQKAVKSLYDQPRELLNETLVKRLGWTKAVTDLKASVLETASSGADGKLDPALIAGKFKTFLTGALPHLRNALSRAFVKQTLADALSLEAAIAAFLLEDGEGVVPLGTDADRALPAIADFLALAGDGLTATYFENETWSEPGQARVDPGIDFRWNAKRGFSVRWEGTLLADKTQRYQLHLRAGGRVKLTMDGRPQPLIDQREDTSPREYTAAVDLEAGKHYGLKLEYSNHETTALVELRWSGPATPAEIVPSYRLYSTMRDDVVAAAEHTYIRLHKVSLLVNGFKLAPREITYLAHPARADALHLHELPVQEAPADQHALFAAWTRWNDFTALRALAPRDPSSLLDVFTASTIPQAQKALVRATDWDPAMLAELAEILEDADYKDAPTLLELAEAMRLLILLRAPAAEAFRWAAYAPSIEQARDAAQEAKRAHKARYDNEAWLDIARPIADRLREDQRAALVAYLLPRLGYTDPGQLFEHFLIDVEMGPCMQTSRIKQAISSVQLFVQRCRMNLEQPQVSPKMIDSTRWQWMQNYRVWEANLKVFLYPENWIEPELRDDKSPFFRELESELLQSEVTTETAEIALGNYLEKLDTVSLLQICGMYEQTSFAPDEKRESVLHVFGHTFASPRVYYYRQLITVNHNYRYWTAWEKVPLDIEADEVLPVIWNRRLYVFWQVLTKQASQASGFSMTTLVRLAWSDYRQGKWSPKKVISSEHAVPLEDSAMRMSAEVTGDELTIRFSTFIDDLYGGMPGPPLIAMSKRSSGITFLNYSGLVRKRVEQGEITYYYGFIAKASTVLKFMPLRKGVEVAPVFGRIPRPGDIQLFGSGPRPYTLYDRFFLQEGPRAYLVTPNRLDKLDVLERLLDPKTVVVPVPTKMTELSIVANPWSTGRASVAATEMRAFSAPAIAQLAAPAVRTERGPTVFQVTPRSTLHDRPDTEPVLSLESQLFQYAEIERGLDLPLLLRYPAEFRFETFFHPYTAEFQRRLNRYGVAGLLNVSSQLPKTVTSFDDAYIPNTQTVRKPWPLHDVDFEFNSAYSLYNWEIFFHVPLFLATRLSQNQRFEEAMQWFHFIFDPTTGSSADPVPQRYWNVLPLRQTQPQRLDEMLKALHAGDANAIAQWEDLQAHPFQPHRVARLRRIAYQKTVVMKYIDNLIAWGDQLFRQDTIETNNQATQLYVLAATLLGPREQRVPPRGRSTPQTFAQLRGGLDTFHQAIVQFENDLPFSSRATAGEISTETTGLLGIGRTFYFCLPKNDKLLGYWDIVADRLFKIRHCMNIEGVVRELPLFEPPIDPALLVKAAAQGIDLSSVLNDLSAPLPYYRFSTLLAKALEMTAELRSLGSALLAALEKRDAEHLANLRASHETELLSLVKQAKQQQLTETQTAEEGLRKSRDVTQVRYDFYNNIPQRIEEETNQLNNLKESRDFQRIGQTAENIISDITTYLPDITTGYSYTTATGWSQKADVTIGRANVIAYYEAKSRANIYDASVRTSWANDASILGGWRRRADDWKLQKDLAFKELTQIDKQIAGANIRVAIARQELDNTTRQIEQSREIQEFLRNKYTGEELYNWMVGDISAIFFQCYQIAYDLAKKAERCYRFERGLINSNFIQFGAWDSLRKGLLSGERLYLQLKQMERAYLDGHRREFELTKHYSLVLNDPQALMSLKELGSCEIELPEALFDIDFPGHYMRRVKSVSLTIPAVVGPYTGVNCTLTLLRDKTRVKSTPGDGYSERDGEEDDRFLTSWTRMQSIATSSGQNDSGMFELNFRDERYLPFEGAGVMSRWRIELPGDFRQFDYDTISDVVLHIKYTAREGGMALREAAVRSLEQMLASQKGRLQTRLFSLRHEFPSEWHRLQVTADSNGDHSQAFSLAQPRFPLLFQGGNITVNSIEIFGVPKDRTKSSPLPELKLTLTGPPNEPPLQQLDPLSALGLLVHKVVKGVGVKVKNLGDTQKEADWTIKVLKADVPVSLDRLEDIMLLCHYSVEMPKTS
jgi:hypothetical protein